MPKNLYLFDVSTFIHAGHLNKYSRLEQVVDVGTTWKTQITPTGGTSLIFNKIYEKLGTGDLVFCCDRNATIKKDMIDGYKSNRNHTHPITVEKAAAEYILSQCGFTVLARAGYEADDIIYTIIQMQRQAYDHIYVYTADSDLYFLVNDNVSILPSSSRAKEVTMDNYNTVLAKYGVKYNTMTINKILFGDKSDCIPPLPKDVRNNLADVFNVPNMSEACGDKSFVRSWFEVLAPDYVYQVDNVFPLYIDDLPIDFKQPDKHLVMNFGNAIHNSLFKGRGSADFDIEPYVMELQSTGCYLEDDE